MSRNWWAASMLAAVTGCGGATRIRVYNDSEHAFSQLVVTTPGASHAFGDLAPRAYTDYRDFGQSYRYARVSLRIGAEEFLIQPIDYVGETPLGEGNFTYAISVTDFDKRVLSISARRDP